MKEFTLGGKTFTLKSPTLKTAQPVQIIEAADAFWNFNFANTKAMLAALLNEDSSSLTIDDLDGKEEEVYNIYLDFFSLAVDRQRKFQESRKNSHR